VKSRVELTTGASQLRWVIVLLVTVVVLPTVCLLWFLVEAVRNERIAVRQKLVDVYSKRLREATGSLDQMWESKASFIETKAAQLEEAEFFELFVRETGKGRFAEGVLVYSGFGRSVLYPVIAAEQQERASSPETFSEAWELEFVEKDFAGALKAYEGIVEWSEDEYERLKASLGKVRCLKRTERTEEAVSLCRKVAYQSRETVRGTASAGMMANARVLLCDLTVGDSGANYESVSKLLRTALTYGRSDEMFLPLDSAMRRFILEQAIVKAKGSGPAADFEVEVRRAENLLAAEELSALVAERHPAIGRRYSIGPGGRLLRLAGFDGLYGFLYKSADKTFLLVFEKSGTVLTECFSGAMSRLGSSEIVFRILDNEGQLAAGALDVESQALISEELGRFLEGWKAELYLRDTGVFEEAASRQIAVYTWSGVLVIALILAAGGLAGRVVTRQIRLNKLKNDFIATVSHELKTPLASMRVLVDTLLAGNIKDQQQAVEYLQMTSKENERLSRLIDNFLTFSRMERNKQGFEMVRTSPGAIAHDAAEAVGSKFNSDSRCNFDIRIDENLPDVLADHDAIVTVLVNLLNNAHKYSDNDKQIGLRVSTEDGFVCFQVTDNGVGLSRRAVKKIFKRFYQVDRSLTRRAEGCGLGLSIVKFIVDAHKGSISVESRPGEGSTFMVKLHVWT